jgi:Ca2+/H+ antiporter
MKRAPQLSAAQTAGLCLLGGLLAALGFLLGIPKHPTRFFHSHGAPATLWALTLMATVALGIGLSLFANSSLGNGIAAARWSDQEIASLRSRLNSRPSNVLYVALVALMVVFLVLSIRSSHLYPVYWALFILTQTVIWLRNTLRRQASRPTHESNWSNIAPLQSDHWGHS